MMQVSNSNKVTISPEEFRGWLDHPVTEVLHQWLSAQRQRLMEDWANGNFTGTFTTEMAVKNAGATGACSAYQQVLDLTFEDIQND